MMACDAAVDDVTVAKSIQQVVEVTANVVKGCNYIYTLLVVNEKYHMHNNMRRATV
jgi:hypothetical protein